MGSLNWQLARHDHRCHVVLTGELDQAVCGDLRSVFEFARESAPVVSVDLSGVEYLDSSGLRCLLDHQIEIHAAGGEMIVQRPSEVVQRLFSVAGVDHMFRIEGGGEV